MPNVDYARVNKIRARGYIRLYDALRISQEVITLFGGSPEDEDALPYVVRGAWPWSDPLGESKVVWFIPLFENENWKQTLIDGGRIIIRQKPDEEASPAEDKDDGVLKYMVHIVFGRNKKGGEFEYVGEFKLVTGGDFGNFQVLKRIATRTDLPRHLDIAHDITVRLQHHATNLFNAGHDGYQKAVWKVPNENKSLWFPRFHRHKKWNNTLIDDGKTIIMQRVSGNLDMPAGRKDWDERNIVVFGRFTTPLNESFLKYLGEFQRVSEDKKKAYFKRIATRTDLPPPKND